MLKKIKIFLTVMILGLFCAASVHAGWLSNGKEQGEWWSHMRARKMKSIPPEMLYHVETDYSFGKNTGSVESKSNDLSIALTLRKDVVTSNTNYSWSDASTTRGDSTVTRSEQSFNEFAFAEVWSWIDIAAGGSWEKNDLRYISDAYDYFLGFYFTLVDSPMCIFKIGAYYGQAHFSFMNGELDKPLDDYDSDMIFFKEKFRFPVSGRITFSQNASYKKFFKDSEYYVWDADFDLNFKVTDNISWFTNYKLEYSNTYVENTDNSDVDKTSSKLKTGIRLIF